MEIFPFFSVRELQKCLISIIANSNHTVLSELKCLLNEFTVDVSRFHFARSNPQLCNFKKDLLLKSRMSCGNVE